MSRLQHRITPRSCGDSCFGPGRKIRVRAAFVTGLCLLWAIGGGCGAPSQTASRDSVDPAPPISEQAKPDDSRADVASITAKRQPPIPPRHSVPPAPVVHALSQWPPETTTKDPTGHAEPVKPVQVPLARTLPQDASERDRPEDTAQPLAQTPEPQQPGMPLLRPGMADELVSVNFDNVDVRTVLKTIGEITGINFIPHQSVNGTVTVMSPTPIRVGDLYAFLQSILDVHGYATVETNNAIKVVPKAEAVKNHLQVRIGADPRHIPRTDVIVTQIVPLQYADAAEVSQIIQPILSSGSQMAIYPRTNSIMITDTSANIHHVAQVIQQLDVEGSKEKVAFFSLVHASAQVLSDQITRIMDKSAKPGAPAGRGRPAQVVGGGIKVLPDNRTNSLIVIAGEHDVETVARLVEELDIQRPVGVNNVHVTYLKNADANEVARSLEMAMSSMRLTGAVDAAQQIQVTADGSTNSLIIGASPQDFEVISQIIEKLDIIREQVMVEMLILEVSEESLLEIGVDWATLDEAVTNSVRGFGLTNLGPRVSFLSGRAEGLSIGAWKATGDGVQIGAILQALHKESGVNILSTPQILTSNHRKATIIVGENRPFVMESRITETDPFAPTVIKSFEYKDVGITLEITPHVSQGGLVRLEISSEFTKLIEDVTTLSLDTPATAKRTAQTVVTMGSGATVVIGGLIRDDTTRSVKKVPLLGDLPLLGPIFQSQRDLSQKTNLLLFITPHVMSTQEDLLNMTNRKKEEMEPVLEASRQR